MEKINWKTAHKLIKRILDTFSSGSRWLIRNRKQNSTKFPLNGDSLTIEHILEQIQSKKKTTEIANKKKTLVLHTIEKKKKTVKKNYQNPSVNIVL